MLNEKQDVIQIPRIYNTSRIHDCNFYVDVFYKQRNDILEKDGYINGFEYLSYLSRDVLNPERNRAEEMPTYNMSQDCKIVIFCGEKAVLSTFKFS